MQIECFDPFYANDLYLYPMKTSSENFLMFLGGIEKQIGMKCVKLLSYSGLSSGIDCSRICFERINWSSRNFTTSVCVSESTLHSSRSWGEKMLLSNVPFSSPWKKALIFFPLTSTCTCAYQGGGGVGNVRFSNTFKRIKSEQRKNG